jgi:RNA polymerase sigma factor (sigma-70 family)
LPEAEDQARVLAADRKRNQGRGARAKERLASVSSDELALFRQVRQRYKILDDDELAYLFDACRRAPDEQTRIHARTMIAYSNVGLVINIARRHANRGVPLADLVHEGLITVYVDAIDNFQPELGYRFSTYATCWIEKAICRIIDYSGTFSALRVPVHAVEELRIVKKARSAFRQTSGHEPGFDELLQTVHGLDSKAARRITPKRLKELLAKDPGVSVSLDAPARSDEGGRAFVECLGRVQEASDAAIVEALDETLVHLDGLSKAIDSLKDAWRGIIAMRYGWFGDPAMTLGCIGEKYGLSRERIRQIVTDVLEAIGRKLRKRPDEVHDLLTLIAELSGEPLLADRSSVPVPDALAPRDGGTEDDRSLWDQFATLSEHAKDWRERGDFVVFAPEATLLARKCFATAAGAKACVAAVVDKGWAEWVAGTDALRLCRCDALPESMTVTRRKKTRARPWRDSFGVQRAPTRMPSLADVLGFLRERALENGESRVVRPALVLVCVRFRLEPQTAARLLAELQRRGALLSSDAWRAVVVIDHGAEKRSGSARDRRGATPAVQAAQRRDGDERRREARAAFAMGPFGMAP